MAAVPVSTRWTSDPRATAQAGSAQTRPEQVSSLSTTTTAPNHQAAGDRAIASLPATAASGPVAGEPASPETGTPASLPTSEPASRIGETTPPPLTAAEVLERYEQAIEQLIARVSPSVVAIQVESGPLPPGGGRGAGSAPPLTAWADFGTGFVIREDGLVLTSQHVVAQPGAIFVTLADGRRFRASLWAADPRSDLAVLRVPARSLPALPWGETASPRRGQIVLAFGNPGGLAADGQAVVSTGLVNGLGRSLPETLGAEDDRYYGDMIQFTAPIAPGSSGGPLVDICGRVLGVITAAESTRAGRDGMGFAVPFNARIRRVVERLLAGESIEYGYVGVLVGSPSEAQRRAAGLPAGTAAVVEAVLDDGAADQAGLRRGDLIISVDGVAVMSPDHFIQMTGERGPGETVLLEVFREGKPLRFELTLSRRPTPAPSTAAPPFGFRGATLMDVDPSLREGGNLPARALLVLAVVEGSPADRAGLTPGDIIVRIEGEPLPPDPAARFGQARGDVLLGLANGGAVVVSGR